MAKKWAKSFYNSSAWKMCRENYIKSMPAYKRGLCERCYSKGKLTPGYILHHKNELTPNNINNTYISLNRNNLEYVCKECHDKEHGVGAASAAVREGLAFDSQGRLIEVAPPD